MFEVRHEFWYDIKLDMNFGMIENYNFYMAIFNVFFPVSFTKLYKICY